MDASLVAPSPSATLAPLVSSALAASRCLTTIPLGGVLSLGPDSPWTTLTQAAVLETPCSQGEAPPTTTPIPVLLANSGLDDSFQMDSANGGPQYSDFRDPFYASTYPVCYVLAATTLTAYMLVIMLFITPRSFLDGGIVYLGRRGFTSDSSSGITIGGRPWLQKVAAMTVAISLTIATADTFRVLEEQYSWGVQNADKLQVEVMDSTELKVIRLVSDTFLWLAQAQTLIRLFPRRREKVIIKWTAFALITLQVIFSALNSFYYTTSGSQGNARPQSFVHAVPALSYLFHLSLGLLYAAWVIYYSLMKKRYAFYHPLMKNMVLVSTLSLLSILVPVVFFILDISRPEFIGWGDYVRWVGAAAASVVVWEWVERIEALEREEKKDGILGREVFDGDEMMEVSGSEFPWLRRRKNRKGGFGGGGADGHNGDGRGDHGTSTAARLMNWPGLTSIPPRYQGNYQQEQLEQQEQQEQELEDRGDDAVRSSQQTFPGSAHRPPLWPARPAPAVTPMSRTDTASAASTDYAVRYQPMSETTGRTPEAPTQQRSERDASGRGSLSEESDVSTESDDQTPTVAAPIPRRQPANAADIDPESQEISPRGQRRWRSLGPLFGRNARQSPATAPSQPTPAPREPSRAQERYESSNRWDFRVRLEDFAATQAEKIREKMQSTPETDSLPVTVVPAPPREGAALAQLLEEEGGSRPGARDTDGGQAPPLERTTSEASEFSNFAGLGATPGLGQRTSNASPQTPGDGDSPAADPLAVNPDQPPLWPGVRVQYEVDDLSDYQPSGAPPQEIRRSPPTP